MKVEFTNRESGELLLLIDTPDDKMANQIRLAFMKSLQLQGKAKLRLHAFHMNGKIYEDYSDNIHAEITL